jgi:hypothetical protein
MSALLIAIAIYFGALAIADALRGPRRRPPQTPGELRASRRNEP